MTSSNTRADAIARSLQAYVDSGDRRTESFEYRGVPKVFDVVRVSPDQLLLNHDNSRLSAQLATHPSRETVHKDPTSSDSQQILAELLRATDQFKSLKEEIRTLGQQNPGLVSRDGLLINGNTRLVAIRDLGLDGFDVAVLPADATPEDYLDLEMSLQMRILTHQNYTFTNRLLLMKRYVDRGHTPEELARKMSWTRSWKKKYEQSMRLLSLIEEIRALSDPPTAYAYFDTKEQHLKDMDEKYLSLQGVSIKYAEQMKWSRIFAMLLGVNKDQVRAIDEDFVSDYLSKRIQEPALRDHLSAATRIRDDDGLDDLLEDPSVEELSEVDLRKVTKIFVTGHLDERGLPRTVDSDLYQDFEKAFRLSAEEIITEQKRSQMMAEPAEELQEIRLSVEAIKSKLGDLSASKEFDKSKFEYQLKKVTRAMDELNRTFDALEPKGPGEISQ